MVTLSSAAQTLPSTTLRILATSDVHGHFNGYNYFNQHQENKGLVHTAALINKARTEVDTSILVENGDLIQGSPMTDWMVASSHLESTLPLAHLLNTLNYDAANLGNHEFNYGLEYPAKAYQGIRFPLLSANLHARSGYAKALLKHQPFALIERDMDVGDQVKRLTIGVVGVLPPQIMQWDAHHVADHVVVEPMVSAAKRASILARAAGADIVVLVAHAGMPKQSTDGHDTEQAVWELAQITGIDAIIFGHQHEVFPGSSVYDTLPHVNSSEGSIFGIPAVQPGVHGEHLGIIDLELQFIAASNTWRVKQHNVSVRAVTAAQDQQLVTLLEPAHQATQVFMQQPIGQVQAELSQRLSRLQPTLAMQLIHDAQRWYIERYAKTAQAEWLQLPRLSAAAPFHAALSATSTEFTQIEAGAVRLGDIGDLYRYPNTLDVVKVSGAQLKRWLEQSAAALKPGQPNDPWSWLNHQIASYQFDTFAGLRYRIDPQQPVGKRVTTESPLVNDQQYVVITNNYRASGGGDFANLDGSQTVYRSPDQIQHILIEYLKSLGEQGYHRELEQNWEVNQ